MTPMQKAAFKLHGEASRYDTLAARAALRAVTGDPRKREEHERLAREHALRSETYAAAAGLFLPTAHGPRTTDKT